MKIFITGAGGFLGGHLLDALKALGHEVDGCDIKNYDVERDIWLTDCRDTDAMRRALEGCEVVIHCAALPHEGLSVFSPSVITDSIYGASVSVFSGAIAAGVRRIVNCSSMSRYGAIPSPFVESDEPAPVDPYGIAKLAAEHTLQALAKIHGIEYVIAVPHSIYGPRQCRTDPYRNVVAIMMNLIMQGKAPIIYGDGLQRRCFSYIDDVIPCLVQMVTSDDKDILGRVINIGPDGGEVSINELCSMVCTEMGRVGPPMYYPDRPAEVRIANCSGELSRGLLGYKPKTSLQEGIRLMADWIREVGPAPFDYFLPIEIATDKTPQTWLKKEI